MAIEGTRSRFAGALPSGQPDLCNFRPLRLFPFRAMNDWPFTDTDRLLVATGFLSELQEADVDCTLTTRDQEDLRRRASSGDEDAFAELMRREPVAA